MGMFDWLFGKKDAATATAPPSISPGPGNLVDGLLQRCKELPPNDPAAATTLLREMLQASGTLPAATERAQELNMALDSMARHYPDALQGLANGRNEVAVRERAIQLLAQRNDPRAVRPALELARTSAAGPMAALLRAFLQSAAEQVAPADLAVLSRLDGKEKADCLAVRDLAGRELRRREETASLQLRMQENLRRWRDEAARSWVEARRGDWNHQDWVDLLASLEKSAYWPMAPVAIGQVLEGLKSAYVARQQG